MRRAVGLLFVLLCLPATAEDAHILLVGAKPDHPHATHMYAFECQLLAKCLTKNPGVRAEYVPAWPPEEKQLQAVDAVVFYSNPSGSVLLLDEHRDRFDKLMLGKTGFVAIHWGTGVGYDRISNSQEHRDLFRSWLGGWFRRPPCDIAIGRASLQFVAAEHEIGRGWEPWEIRDEFYLNPVLDERSRPLLKVAVDGTDHVVGWTLEREQGGRSVGITLGHFHDNFVRDDFRKMLANSILWAAHVEVPGEGANVSVSAADTSLPKVAK